MGRRRDANPVLTTALCVSMTAHALAMSGIAWWFVRHAPPTYLAGPTQLELIRLRPPPPAVHPPRPKPRRRPPPPPPVPMDVPDSPLRDDSGEHDGHGTANRSTAGDEPMRAQRGLEQADLKRTKKADPTLIDPTAARTAQAGQRQAEDALPTPRSSPQKGTYHPDFVAAAAAADADPAGEVVTRAAAGVGPLPPSPVVATPTDNDPPPAPSGVRASAVKTSTSIAPPPAAREARGRDSTASDTESMAFSPTHNALTFHAGRVEGRKGKDVRLEKFVFGTASENDLMSMGDVHAVFAIHVRADATVALVETVKSSGSDFVDEDCTRTLYRSTFEADTDRAGHPVETVWIFTFN